MLVNRITDFCNCPYLDCTWKGCCSLARQTPNPFLLEVISTRFNWCMAGNPSSENEATGDRLFSKFEIFFNKAKLGNLIAATGLVILLKLDSNRHFQPLWPWNLMNDLTNNIRAPLLYYAKLCVSFQIHWLIQTGVTVRKPSIRVKIGDFLSRVALKFDGWPWKQLVTSSVLLQALCIICVAIGEFKLE